MTELFRPSAILANTGAAVGSQPSGAAVEQDASGAQRRRRDTVLDVLGAAVAAALLLALAYRAWRETGGSNSYAALADAWLHGRLWVERCFDIDCVTKDGLTHVIFPPVPALLAVPFVAAFGVGFAGFVLLAIVLGAVAAACWWSIARQAGADPSMRAWLLGAIMLASPVFYVMLRADGIWFFAQSVGFALSSTMLWACLVRRSAVLAGACVALAFLSRQMALLAAPAAFLLLLPPHERLLVFGRERLKLAAAFAAPIVAALAVYLAYNAARFGNPLDTGYGLLTLRHSGSIMDERLTQNGTFSSAYVVQNLLYLLVQGFHAEFTGPKMLTLSGLDPFGTSLLAASPWLFALALARPDRRLLACAAGAALIAGVTLFYHSNGFTQYNAQRYALDWLPLLLVFLPSCFMRLDRTLVRALVLYGMALNGVMLAVLQVTRG